MTFDGRRSSVVLGGLVLLVCAAAASPSSEPTVRIEATARGVSSHALARPVDDITLSAANGHALLGRISWWLGVEILVDASTARSLSAMGETSVDARGGDGGGVLRSAWNGGLRDTGEAVVLVPPDGVEPAGPLSAIDPIAGDVVEGVRVRGRVLTVDGRPLAGAHVAARGRPPVITDRAGRFECRVAHVGEPVRAWFAGRRPSEPVESQAESFDVRIGVPTACIVVRTPSVDRANLAWIERVPEGESPGLHGDDRGDIRVPGVAAGRYRLRISAPGHGSTACEIRARAGHTTTVEVSLPRSTLRDRLRGERLAVEIVDEPLTDALWEVMQRSALPVSFERTLGDAARRPVSIEGEHPLEELLDALCDAAGTRWQVDEEAWLIRVGTR